MKLPSRLAVKYSGLTLLETLLAAAILLVILAIGLPVSWNFYLSYQLDSETRFLDSLLKQARNFAMVNYNESDHGLYIASDKFIAFQGASFASRVQSQDRVFPRVGAITVSGPSEIVFSALSGRTASTTFTLSDNRSTTSVSVNLEGLVYE